jgi:exodeoxyribonuclease VII large subunit
VEEKRKIYSVGELNRVVKNILERGVGDVWVEGEISRLTRHSSGHWYFTLKDETASVSCAMFKPNNAAVPFEPKDGVKVRVFGQTSLYEPSGKYQMIVRTMEEAGKGSLQEQFEKLKCKLSTEGLFDADRKKPIPMLPQKIGVITSPTGAAVRDIIHVLNRRFPKVEVLLAPVTVQGEGAAKNIAAAIQYLNHYNCKTDGQNAHPVLPINVLIVGRGGGSLENLWAFNEEVVARAIAKSDIPVISAVGHEIDFTISDFVADVRAPTPSIAAELAVPVKSELEMQIKRLSSRLSGALENRSLILKERIPGFRQAMGQALRSDTRQRQQRIDEAALKLTHEAKNSISFQRQRLPGLQQSMKHHLKTVMEERKQKLQRLEVQLRTLNPLGVLERGYSLTQNEAGYVIRNTENIKPGDLLKTQFAKGTVLSEVKDREE